MQINEIIQAEITASEAQIAQAQTRIEALKALEAETADLMAFARRVASSMKVLPKTAIASLKRLLLGLFDDIGADNGVGSPIQSESNDSTLFERYEVNHNREQKQRNGLSPNQGKNGKSLSVALLDDCEQSAPEQTAENYRVENNAITTKSELQENSPIATDNVLVNGAAALSANNTYQRLDSEACQNPDTLQAQLLSTHIVDNHQGRPPANADLGIARFVKMLTQAKTLEELMEIKIQQVTEGVDLQLLNEALPQEVRNKVKELASKMKSSQW